MKKTLYLLILCTFTLNLGISVVAKDDLDTLIEYSKINLIPDTLLLRAEELVYELMNTQESLPKVSITYLYGLICQNSVSTKGVTSYIQYLKINEDSAEEELSFQFEAIFFKSPGVVLEITRKQDTNFQKSLLNRIGWGFLNNSQPLTKNSYKSIFFAKNPEVKSLYKIYRKEIDVIFQGIDEYYVWLESRRK